MKTRVVAAVIASSLSVSAQVSLYDLRGATGDQFCRSVAGIGDLDGDGVRDFLVGAPQDDGAASNEGSVVLVSGATGAGFAAVFGAASGDAFGFSVAAIGDVDEDGVEDFAVGAPYADVGNWADAGRAHAFSGATRQVLLELTGSQVDGRLGWDVASFRGDVVGGPDPDWAVSAPGVSNARGSVTFVDGDVGAAYVVNGVQSGGLYGWSIDGVGDTNGNGVLELLVGAPTVDTNGWTSNGVASLVEFSTTLAIKGGIGNNVQLGTSVAGLGDTNGDGVPDFAFGAPQSSGGGFGSGEAHVYSGAGSHTELWSVVGEPFSSLGHAIAAAGDVDGDGLGDLIAGAPFSDAAGFDRGRADVYSGLDGSTLATQFGYANDDEMGRTVAGVGDVNGDGFDDYVAGAPFSDGNGANSGWAHFGLSNQPPPTTYCVGKENSAGCTPTIGYVGCPSISISNYFHIQSHDTLPGKPGLLIWAYGQAAIPFLGGTLCLQPPIQRGPIQVSADTGGACGGLFSAPFAHAEMAQAGMTAGTTFNAQFWSRDPGFAAPNDVALTPGLAITILP